MSGAERLRAYAQLVVRVGVNLQPGQELSVGGLLEHAPLAEAIARAAYEAGARHVDVLLFDQHARRAQIELGPEDALDWSPPWLLERLRRLGEVRGARIAIVGDPEPDLLADLDPRRVARARAMSTSRTPTRTSGGR